MTGRPLLEVHSAITLVLNELTLMVANADRAGTDLQSGDMNPLTHMQTSNDKEQELGHLETQCEEKDRRIENLSDENVGLQREKEALLHQLEEAVVRCQNLQAEEYQMEVTLDHLRELNQEKDSSIQKLQQLENVLKIDVHEVELTEQRLGGGAYGGNDNN